MKTGNLIWGIFLITFGILLLLGQFDLINFSFWSIFKLWPLVLVLVGVSLLSIGKTAKIIASIIISASIFIMAFTVDMKPDFVKTFEERIICYNSDYDSDIYDNDTLDVASQNSEPLDYTTEKGKLDLVLALGSYKIQGDNGGNLYDFNYNPDVIKYKVSSKKEEGVNKIEIAPFSKIKDTVGRVNNTGVLKLNSQIPWEIEIESATSSLYADLSSLKVDKLDISGGVSNLDIKLGGMVKVCNVEIDAGISKIKISIPKDVGCKIIEDGAIQSLKLNGGFYSKGDVKFSDNYDSAINKININLDNGISSVTIDRY